jgi:hypothetical protein
VRSSSPMIAAVAAVASVFASRPAAAYDIFPSKIARILHKQAIHEQLALASRLCADKDAGTGGDGAIRCDWPLLQTYVTVALPALSDGDWAMVNGVEWPDNPVRTAKAQLPGIGFAKLMATDCRHYRGPTGGLLCKSHYYDLQFFHSMAQWGGQAASETRQQVLEWLHFLYAAAMNPDVLDATLGERGLRHDSRARRFLFEPCQAD